MTLILQGTDNSVSSPAVQGGTAGATTGIYYPATNVVALATNGTEALRVDASQNVGIGTSGGVAGLTVYKYGTQWTGNTSNTYPVPAGNVFIQTAAISGQDNWIGTTGSYGATTGSSNLLLQANLNNTSQQAGNYIGSEATGSGTAVLTFGRMIGAATTGGNATKSEQLRINTTGNLILAGGTVGAGGTGITFPATQSASSDANCLDDYEEGTWTPNQGAGLTVVGTFSSNGTYTKVGNIVTVQGQVSGSTSIAVTSVGILSSNLPFTQINVTGSRGTGGAFNATGASPGITFGNNNTTTVYSASAISASGQIFFNIVYQST